jgi:hypothetical protein
MSPAHPTIEAQLNAIQERCAIGPYFLRSQAQGRVSIEVPPEVRARPLRYGQMECLRVELAKSGLRLEDAPPLPTPATTADLQAILARVHFFCELGPYKLTALSATRAVITIDPTMRVRPLSRMQHRCLSELVKGIKGVKLERGIVPTVD